MKIKVITHYSKDDPEFGHDDFGKEILIDGARVYSISDPYHNDQDGIDGYLKAIKHFFPDAEISEENAADGEEFY